MATGDNEQFLRNWWKTTNLTGSRRWFPYAKGGEYSKYYSDVYLVVDWEDDGLVIKMQAKEKYGSATRTVKNQGFYLREGLTFPLVTVKGFNVRILPAGCIFDMTGPAIFFNHDDERLYNLGFLNSSLAAFFLSTLTDSRHWQVLYVQSIPYKKPTNEVKKSVDRTANAAFQLKYTWDTGNEICTRFTTPWLHQLAQPQSEAFAQGLGCVIDLLGDGALTISSTQAEGRSLADLLGYTHAIEDAVDAHLQALQAQIDEAVYDLYEITPADRALIERELGERPPELVWPQMEGKSDRDKRCEHVRRLFSYYALQVMRQDQDGIVPLTGGAARDLQLVNRLRNEMEAQFGPTIAYQLEQDAAAYLGRPLEDWLLREFFRFHVKLYKNRPILWHITSPKAYFAVMVNYHRLTHDTLPKIQALYLWPQMEAARTRLAAVRTHEDPAKVIADLEDELQDLQTTDKRLAGIIDNGYDPDIDDGVKVNLLPIQEAGLLPVKKVV